MRMIPGVLASILALWLAGVATAGRDDAPAPPDADKDGLSDFDEIHKYRTDPGKSDSDGDGKPDGDWDERREYTYSIRTLVNHLAPAMAVSDGWQDAREVHRDGDYVELEIVTYPLATPNARLDEDDDRTPLEPWLKKHVAPNLTNDYDEKMQEDLRAALKNDGIDVDKLGDRALVEKVARWAWKRMNAGRTGFNICYVTEKDGQLVIEAGLEERAKSTRSDPTRSFEEQLDIEVRGASMYRKKQCGACTSTAVYLQTVLRALGVPTRTTITMPPADAGDERQLKMIEEGVRPSRFRDRILKGASVGPGGWVEHTINVVWVGGRWMRLNYSTLGNPVVDPHYCGLMLRILDYDDRATAGTARTWGRRYGKGLRSARWPYGNNYALLAISDRMGAHANVTLPEGSRPDASHEKLTVTRARWSDHRSGDGALIELDCAEWFDDQDGDQYKRFTQAVDRVFFLRAKGQPDVLVECGVGSITGHDLHAVALFLPKATLAKLEPGVAYRVEPRNEHERLKWAIEGEVTITRK